MEKKWRSFVTKQLGTDAEVIALEFREQLLPRLHEVAEKNASLYRQSRTSSFARCGLPRWRDRLKRWR